MFKGFIIAYSSSVETMPPSCSVLGCKSRGYENSRKFYSFPQLNHRSHKTLELTRARQNAWLIALNRENFHERLFKCARVCDLHFISGKFLFALCHKL